MRLTDKLLIVAFILVSSCAVVSVSGLLYLRNEGVPTQYDTSIVRLHRPVPGGGMIFCSGTVINATHILTAAHCMVATEFDVEAPTIEIRTNNNEPLGLTAQILSLDTQSDLAVLYGDFHVLSEKKVVTGAEEINKAVREHEIVICGYPHDGRFTCSTVKQIKNYFFMLSGVGFAYPGMSGGPIIDTSTGKVLGVVTAVQENLVLLSPAIELNKDLHLSESN